jgi:DNA repair exonuclease SbcCD ATPase subunit
MRLSRVRIEALRQFREPIEIDGLQDGMNLFVGPNGAGKSTIVRAIRAAFFERYASISVTDLLPWGEPGAGPSVEVEFVSGGQQYHLRKRFLARKRCRLDIDGKAFENAEAEGRLADLLGFQYAGKGASKPEHWGVPGLLWIQQGNAGQELHDAVGHATDHLRKALDKSLGEVASTGGDDVFDRVQAEREKLLTRTGQPTGELKEATGLLAAAREKLAALAAQLAAYRDQVDRFGFLTAQIQAGNREQPWKRFEAQARVAQERLDQISKLREALAADRRLLLQTEAQIRLLEQQQASFAQDAGKLEQRRQAAGKAAARLADAEHELAPRRQQLEAAQLAQDQAQVALLAAEQQEGRRRLLERLAELRKQHAGLDAASIQAREIMARLNGHRQEIAAKRIGDEQLETLRRNERELQAARIRLEAVATSLSFQLEPGKTIERDGVSLQGAGHSQLLRRTVLTIPQVGTITIEPGGGHDLAKLTTARETLESAQASLLQSLGLDGLAGAEQRLQQRKAAEQAAQFEQKFLDQLAPKGLEALVAELAAVAGELADVQARLAQAGEAGNDGSESPLPTVEDARRAHAEALQRLRQAQAAEQEARATWAAAKGAAVHADGELSVLQAALQDEDYQRRVAQNQAELQATRLRFGSLAAKADEAERSIDAAQPQVLQQDVERLDRSARQALAAHDQRRVEVISLQSQLDAAGANGLEEQLAEAHGKLERLQRRHLELERRAQALDLLAAMLRSKRQALTKRLQAPLLKHLNHYLQLLMPGASVTIDEALKPVALSLASGAASGAASGQAGSTNGHGGFDDLSFGTREQISLISRLAYADLLKEASRPTLIILDDCLVNTDTARMSQMKRILYDAATRHQILLFSCHPERWEDLGTVAREVLSLRSAQRLPGTATRAFAPAPTTEIDAS